ncbi:MAG: hypothetical protein ACRDN9_10435, partial [Streptosporangiaceae bacterium]
SETPACQTECLLDPKPDAALHIRVRFLQVQARSVEESTPAGWRRVEALEVGGAELRGFDEAVERAADAAVPVAELLDGERRVPFEFPAWRTVDPVPGSSGTPVARTVREGWPLTGVLVLSAERLDGPYGGVRLRARVENTTEWHHPEAPRAEALRRSLVAAHTLLGLGGGRFISLLDPPEWASAAAKACDNQHTWPVLVGDEYACDVMLSSPIILYDFPSIAPESPGDLFDATEIDELLTLRTMALTEEEKREARGTDTRAAEIIDRADTLPPEMMERLHGAIRSLGPSTGGPGPWDDERSGRSGGGIGGGTGSTEAGPGPAPWWDPGVDASVSPETDAIPVAGVSVAKGSRVLLRPRTGRADAQDMFLEGRTGVVEAVFHDVDGSDHLAVTLEEDPAADLMQWHGRYLYFAPDEIEPLGAST